MKKVREQFELFSYDETHNITEWDDAQWICDCPKVQTDILFHCGECKAEPPGGCQFPQCADLTTFWEQ